MEGYVKLYRKMTEWEWYKDNNTKSVFIHLLLTVNIKETRYMGMAVPRGSILIKVESAKGGRSLCDDLGLTPREVRTALSHLESSGEITRKTTNKNTLITVVNYEVFQGSENKNDNQTTSSRQTNDKLTTSIEEEGKEGEEGKEKRENAPAHSDSSDDKSVKHKHGEYGWVLLSDGEYERLKGEFGGDMTAYYIAYVDESAQSTKNKNKWQDWNLVIRKAIRNKWGNYTPGVTQEQKYEEGDIRQWQL